MKHKKRKRDFEEDQSDANRINHRPTTSSGSQEPFSERSSRKRKFNYADPNDDYTDIGDFSDSGSDWEPSSDEDCGRSLLMNNEIMNVNFTGVETVEKSINAEVNENLENQSSIMHPNISDLSVGDDGESIATSTSTQNLPNEVNTPNRENILVEANTSNEGVNGKYFLSRIIF